MVLSAESYSTQIVPGVAVMMQASAAKPWGAAHVERDSHEAGSPLPRVPGSRMIRATAMLERTMSARTTSASLKTARGRRSLAFGGVERRQRPGRRRAPARRPG